MNRKKNPSFSELALDTNSENNFNKLAIKVLEALKNKLKKKSLRNLHYKYRIIFYIYIKVKYKNIK